VHDTALAFETDRERDRLLMLAGWRIARFTWRQVTECADVVAAQTRALLALPSTT
jgi:very-short-patch-repair endonuclease